MINKSLNDIEINDEEPGKLFVGGLSWETTDEKLQQYFSEFGEVIDSTVMKNTDSGQSRGFGFVTFADPNCVANVLAKGTHLLDGRAIDPKPCSTKAAIKSKKNSQYPKVFLGGLPFNVTETDLRSIFSRFGEVMDVIIMYDHEKNKCRVDAVDMMEEKEEHLVEVKRAEPRDGRSSTTNQWSNLPNTQNMDVPRNPTVQNYQGWGAAPATGYGYGTPTGGPMPYGGWGGPPPQWGPGYPNPGYPQYGGPQPPYGNWNWNVPPQPGPGVLPPPAAVTVPPTNGASPAAPNAVPPSDPYGRPATAIAAPQNTPVQPAVKPDYSNYSGYSGYVPDGGYSPGTNRTYSMDPNVPATESYSGAPGPQRNNQSQQGYHPYRRV